MKITVQPALLQWARHRAGLREADLGKKLGIKKAPGNQVEQWERDGIITYSRVEKIAKITHTPFGYLFLSAPPMEVLPVADFRTVGSEEAARPSPELLDVLYDAMRKQSWYRDYLLDLAENPLDFIGSVTLKQSPVVVAVAIRKRFRFDVSLRAAAENWEQALGFMFDHCEDEGVMVIRSGVADGNTHRALKVEEFRGFALTDAYAPLVFINTADSPAAQMFTLVHELVHLWLGVSGVSNLEWTYAPEKKVEAFCNHVAAEVLVPLDELEKCLKEGIDEMAALRRRFKVSSLVILRRLKDLGKMNAVTFQKLYREQEEAFILKKSKQKSGGNYYATQQVRTGRRFARALIGSAMEGRTPYRDAYGLLGIKKAETFRKFAEELNSTL
jgi:Zn-dependent peptidase ImmA (M78 family)/transcriptional regulator with XRE-family HTH domain